MRVAVIGSRKFTDKRAVDELVASFPPNTVLVSGGCRGTDLWAESKATSLKLATSIYKPDLNGCLNKYEITKAYYARNRQIVENSDLIHAFVAKDRKGGTEYTIQYARKLGKPVIIHMPTL